MHWSSFDQILFLMLPVTYCGLFLACSWVHQLCRRAVAAVILVACVTCCSILSRLTLKSAMIVFGMTSTVCEQRWYHHFSPWNKLRRFSAVLLSCYINDRCNTTFSFVQLASFFRRSNKWKVVIWYGHAMDKLGSVQGNKEPKIMIYCQPSTWWR